MANFINLDLSLLQWAQKVTWWAGTFALVIGLHGLSKSEFSPGLFAAVMITPFMCWHAAKSFRIRDLEKKVEELEEESADD